MQISNRNNKGKQLKDLKYCFLNFIAEIEYSIEEIQCLIEDLFENRGNHIAIGKNVDNSHVEPGATVMTNVGDNVNINIIKNERNKENINES
jgi:hypothetical protein